MTIQKRSLKVEKLARIYDKEHRYGELAHTLTRKVELSQDPTDSIALRMRIAELCEAELSDPEAHRVAPRGASRAALRGGCTVR